MKCEFCGSTYSLEELDKLAEQQDTVEEVRPKNGKGLNRNSGSQMRSQIWQCGTVRPVELKYWPKKTTGSTVCPYCDKSNDYAGTV